MSKRKRISEPISKYFVRINPPEVSDKISQHREQESKSDNSNCLVDLSTSGNACTISLEQQSSDIIHKLDIGNFVSNTFVHLSDEERFVALTETWMPESGFKFPICNEGGHSRSFQHRWLKENSWLAYSKKDEGAYCIPCVLFVPVEGGRSKIKLGNLVSQPLKKFKKALEVFKKHSENDYHKACVLKAEMLKRIKTGDTESINKQLNSEVKRRIEENRKRLVPIVKSIIFCARQNMGFRGHCDDGQLHFNESSYGDSNINEGNFRELLKFRIDAGDKVLEEHLKTSSKNCTFISKTTQNDLIECCGAVVSKKLLEKVKKHKFFSIICDETTDVSTQEQLALCIRHFDTEKYTIHEDFIHLVSVVDLTGEGLSKTIFKSLTDLGLDLNFLRGQGYDGGSNMSGCFQGLQAHIRRRQPLAFYTHCASHCLNLSLSNACKIPDIRNAIAIASETINCIRASPKRTALFKKSLEELNLPQRKLKAFCETRFVEKHYSIIQFVELYPAIVKCLEEISETTQDAKILAKAISLHVSIQRFNFIISINIVSSLFAITLPLSRQLQDPSVNISQAFEMVDHVCNTFKNKREDTQGFKEIYSRAVDLASQFDIEVTIPRTAKHQTQRINVPTSSPMDYYRVGIYLPFIDYLITNLTDKLQSDHQQVIANLQKILPKYIANPDTSIEDILESVKCYSEDIHEQFPALRGELELWRDYWRQQKVKPTSACDSYAHAANGYYPNIAVLLHLMCVLPVTTCSAERVFSTLKKTKTYLRSTIGNERLLGLMLLQIHRDLSINADEIINVFAEKHPRKLQLKEI